MSNEALRMTIKKIMAKTDTDLIKKSQAWDIDLADQTKFNFV